MQAATRFHEPWRETEEHRSVAALFADSIERLYRVAISVDPSQRSQIAYGCYLAEHGQPFEAFREFDDVLNHNQVAENSELLAEIVARLCEIETCLENTDTLGSKPGFRSDHWEGPELCESAHADGSIEEGPFAVVSEVADALRQLMDGTRERSPHDFSRIVSELDLHTLEDVRALLSKVRRDRTLRERRRTGMSLLKLALFCGRKQWCHMEVECIREAVRCFADAAQQIRNGRTHANAELTAASMRRI